VLLDPILDARLAAADFLQRLLAAFLIQLFEPVEVSREYPIILQACETLPNISANFSTPTLFLMIFGSVFTDILLLRVRRSLSENVRSSSD
jgi:hypothetical protein